MGTDGDFFCPHCTVGVCPRCTMDLSQSLESQSLGYPRYPRHPWLKIHI